MQMIRAVLLMIFAALAPSAQAQTLNLPQPMHTSINDFAGLLTPADTEVLDKALIALHAETGVQGTVVTITDRARYGDSPSIEDFATRLFNFWGVGDKTRNDGFMVLVSRQDREARIELGRGYPAAADKIAATIMNRVMVPSFNEQNYSAGLREGTLAVIERIARPQAAGTTLEAPRGSSEVPGFAIFAALAAGMLGLQFWQKRRRNRCPKCGHQGLELVNGEPVRETLPDGSWRTAQQMVTRRCPNCGWEKATTVQLPVITYYDRNGTQSRIVNVRNDNNDSGSSGFGGGSSSGGGASGRW